MNEWSSKCNFSNKPSYYIPNCVNDEQIKLVLKKTKHIVKSEYFDSQKFNIVCVASIQYMKGQDIIFNQYERLVKLIPETKIYLVGAYKNVTDDFSNKIINNLNSKDYSNIKYLGRRTDALDLIYAADCLLLPSRGEAMPRVVLEAMALKTPIVASNVDGIPELIDDGVHGYTFDIEDSDGLLRGIASVYKGQAEECVKNAFNKYWENFSFERLKIQYQKLLG